MDEAPQSADTQNGDNVVFLHADEALAEEVRIATRLVESIRNGDSAAETELVERYSRGLSYVLKRRINDDERARDLLQETLLIAIAKLREVELDNPGRLAGYLRGIAIRVTQNARRKRDREPTPIDNELVEAFTDQAAGPFARLSVDESRAAVHHLIDRLPTPRDRELLRRFYTEEQDKQDICAALDLSSEHFNRVLYRAKQRFRKIVEEFAGDV